LSNVRSIHPLVGFLAITWVMIALYINSLVSALLLSLMLMSYLITSLPLESIRRLVILYLWVVLPPYVVLTIIYGPLDALDVVLRLFIIASTFTSVLQLMKPIELVYISARLGVPPLAALAIPMIIKLADYMSYSVGETLIALRGRGLSGRKLLTNLPIPLIVHVVMSSAQMAESIAQKQLKNLAKYAGKPAVRAVDVVIITYILANIVVVLIQIL